MEREEPLLFKKFPNLKKKIPWIPLLTQIPTPVERLTELEKSLDLSKGQIYIKRDDKNHHIYGGNKLRKFEFIFGDVVKKKKKGVITIGGIGTNHGLACSIICKYLNPPLKCELFLFSQPLTWHVQRSLLIFHHFRARLHLSNGDIRTFIKALLFQLIHPKYYFMFPGGSPLFGFGNSLGTIGFINAVCELKKQIEENKIPEPDVIFIAGGSNGTSGGLVAGCKLLRLKTKVHVVAVYDDFISNPTAVRRNANKALKHLNKYDRSIPKIKVSEDDFEFTSGYLGSGYGIKTIKSQNAVDTVHDLEGKTRDFKLETTYTGKTIAGMLEFLKKGENKSKKVLFWNTYNSNDLDHFLMETDFNYKELPKKFHKFYEDEIFQCWQITDCPLELRNDCSAYLNHEFRFWKITDCLIDDKKREKAYKALKNVIKLEEA
ncbi:MAG: 1-aminocyclopropane-1-carboxylate deaminase/D-cysteine desulfhydrase [Promethearchaeota archaeon]|jgi:D-cysteine desulfhydrase